MIICSIKEIGKSYGGNIIFDNLSLEINEKECIGLVGRNGSGKTTLLKIIAGIETQDTGQVHWKKGLKTGYLAQVPDYPRDMTVEDVLKTAFQSLLDTQLKMTQLETEMGKEKEQVKLEKLINLYGELQDYFIQHGGYEIDSSIDRVVNGLNIASLLPQLFNQLSGGERTKVGLALILLKNPDLLLLDEPTNHLDLQAVEWLGSFIREYSGTVILISHDRYFLDEVVNKIVDLEDGELQVYHADFTGYAKEKEERLLIEFQAYQEQQKKIRKMKEAIKRLKEWANRANPPNEGLHKRARNMERALERMVKLDKPLLNRKKIEVDFDGLERSGKDVVTFKEVAKSYDSRVLFEQVNMHVQYGEKVAIIGENGTGKSTLIKMMLEYVFPDKGEIKLGSNLNIGYLSQHVYSNSLKHTVIEEFRNEVHVSEGEARHILARFLFYGHSVFRKVNQLSGGERMRLRLAQLMCKDINLLILDEPTNHLDIDSVEVIEEALEGFHGTIIAVSHDRYFLNRLFNRIYWLEDQTVHCFEGNYEWAKQKMVELRQLKESPSKTTSHKDVNTLEIKAEKDKLLILEQEIEQIEYSISEIHKKMRKETELQSLQALQYEVNRLELRRNVIYEELEKAEGE
ncbi:ribosomal protection-like ABC-F family protein [Heyndrickxia camelliae]|uniref:ABC transporter ATP-binding protein n=1 Tax=Heyndrickxia camelliae TaxID=1707093 RepID=A0A2N3LK43_9BACI|nr:ABC-F type ribosomal protection protein [Heyndrickxia camelliae]PKR84955.1 ABC transporter ATP-binding protein [Heyndrickxia camelliae]